MLVSQNSLNGFLKSPRRGATVHDDSRPSSSATIRKRPIPTPRSILNTSQGSGSEVSVRNRRNSVGSSGRIYSPLDRLILKYGEPLLLLRLKSCPKCFFISVTSGQLAKHFMLLNYDSRVVPDLKIPHITTQMFIRLAIDD